MSRSARLPALLAAAFVLAGCAPAGGGTVEIGVALYQSRTDVAAGLLEIQVENRGTEPIVVRRAVVDSTGFAEPMVWERDGSTVHPGRRLDLPVELAEPRCDGPEPPTRIVELSLTIGEDAEPVELDVEAEDPFGQVERLREDGCLAASLAEISELRIVGVAAPDRRGAAMLELEAVPGTAPGGYTVDALRGTTLFAPADGRGLRSDEQPVGATLDATGGGFRVPIVPARCDEHAVLEDKQGTLFPFLVTRDDGTTGRVVVTSPDSVRSELYEYVARYCGHGGD